MHNALIGRVSAALVLSGIVGCGGPPVPAGTDCPGDTVAVATDAELAAALAAAAAGDCVVLAAGRYAGPVVVPAVTLTVTAEDGARAEVDSADDGVVVGAGATVQQLHVTRAGRHAFVLLGPGARALGAEVLEAGAAGVMIKCEDPGCMGNVAPIEVRGAEVMGAGYGLYVAGAVVRVSDASFGGSRGESLGGGAGVYAVAGADLELERVTIDDNVYGLVADGAGTRVRLSDTTVTRNADLGVWVQGLRGSAAAPAFELVGAASRVVGNGVTGLGAFDSAGVAVSGAEIGGTVEKEVLVDLINRVRIGDGVGLLAGTREVEIASARLVGNARAQAIVDAAGADIHFTRTNTISGGQHRVVVQNGTAVVDVPASQRSMPGAALGVQLAPVALRRL